QRHFVFPSKPHTILPAENAVDEKDSLIHAEAAMIYKNAFGELPSELFIERYRKAHDTFAAHLPTLSDAQIRKLMNLDLEAIEMVMRLRGKRHYLNEKFQIAHYLAEAEPGNL